MSRIRVPLFWALLSLSCVGSAWAQDEQANATPYQASEIEGVVAPIALYPDSLLAQVFMASTYPMEVVEAARWRESNKNLKDKALEDALKQKNWDASVKSLTTFPEVLSMMDEKLDWTQKLGDMFLAQQKDVMDAVQRLRAKAKAEGNLETTEQQTVTEEPAPAGSSTTTIIEVQPTNPQVVYVPSYNPTVVYGSWPYPAYPPYSPYPPGYVWGTAALSFGMGMATAALWGNCNWGGGDIDVDVNNNFNRNTNIDRGDRTNVGGDRGSRGDRGSGKWNHSPEHRKGAGYRDKASQNKYGKGDRAKASSRDQFRGRAEQGRQQIGREGAGNVQRQMDRAGGARGGDRASASQRPSGGSRDRAGASNRGGSRPSTADRSRGSGGSRSSSAMSSNRSGKQTRMDSSRGRSSQQSARSRSSGGSRSSMGGSRGGGGGSRGGGGGGRGGGGGGRGGGGGGRRR